MKKKTAKKKPAKKKVPTFRLIVQYEEEVRGGEPTSDEDYSERTDTRIDFRLKTVLAGKAADLIKANSRSFNYEEFDVKFDPEGVNYVWVVLARYEDGDTFGRSYGHGHIEGVYDSLEEACEVTKSIGEDKYSGWAPWTGYFSRLEGVSAEPMPVFYK